MTTFLTRAVESTGVRPHTATTDKGAIFPSELGHVLPEISMADPRIPQLMRAWDEITQQLQVA